jgi:hypothetical protein
MMAAMMAEREILGCELTHKKDKKDAGIPIVGQFPNA